MSFEEYVTEQGHSLLRLAYVLTGDAHRAEDLTQTALTDAYRQWRKVAAARQPDAYVRRILVNAHLNWHRRRSSTERPTDLAGWEPAGTADPADGVADRDQLRQVLATLAPRARTALVLRYYADLDDAGIAEAMGVTVSAVRATTSRALATLRASGVAAALKETS
ncbi:SigE family RNA polymerase sigma factor [Actinoplanes auranticolor]|uniref:RNA polymerase subunit sigma-24 n=1 Tax=Actinoplanes auranticolor TaxID=47988 RepID=A0A919VLV9_9ACTN|nr:SigE family RNA polymerase sigma factor [Actinoplanes auranticolor]GIM71019.1 RNA polymerase subunit sigma-24 [Actinoplanes auranticolor]